MLLVVYLISHCEARCQYGRSRCRPPSRPLCCGSYRGVLQKVRSCQVCRLGDTRSWSDQSKIIYLNVSHTSVRRASSYSLRYGSTPWDTPDGMPTNSHGTLPGVHMNHSAHVSTLPRNKKWRKHSKSTPAASDPRKPLAVRRLSQS
jgi:hypothetical protein